MLPAHLSGNPSLKGWSATCYFHFSALKREPVPVWCRATVTLRICVGVSRVDPIPVSQASYMALVAKSGMIHGSV
jgi:hypothetical protein